MSFRPMVRTGSDPVFYGNALRFATREEAQRSADDLMARWTLVVETAVHATNDRVTHRIDLATGEMFDERISAPPGDES
jgi:hypothetical protein